MTTLRSMFRVVALASAAFLMAVPAVASAGEGRGQGAAEEAKQGRHGKDGEHGKDGKDGKERRFPVKAEKFQKVIEKRLGKAREKLEAHMKEKNLPEDKRAALRKDFEAGATEVRALAKQVGEDGTVTKEEAQKVRELARSLKHKARDKHGKGGEKHGKAR